MAAVDRFTSSGPQFIGSRQTERYHTPATGSGGGTTDTIARTAAGQAQNNVNAITAQPSEIIAPGVSVFGPWGQLTNNTLAGITLDATDPQTEATLLAAGLTAPTVSATPETATHVVVPSAAFGDVEAPLLAEVVTYRDNTVGSGLAIDTPQTPSDTLSYESAQGKRFLWIAADGESGTPTLILASTYDPAASGGVETITASVAGAITPNGNPRTLNQYILTAATPVTSVNVTISGVPTATNVVAYTLRDPITDNEHIDIMADSTEQIHILSNVNGDAGGFVFYQNNRWMRLRSRGGTWVTGE